MYINSEKLETEESKKKRRAAEEARARRAAEKISNRYDRADFISGIRGRRAISEPLYLRNVPISILDDEDDEDDKDDKDDKDDDELIDAPTVFALM